MDLPIVEIFAHLRKHDLNLSAVPFQHASEQGEGVGFEALK